MLTDFRGMRGRVRLALILAVSVALMVMAQPAHAATQGQTIPTAPPPTEQAPTAEASTTAPSPRQPPLALTLTPSTVPTQLVMATTTPTNLVASPVNLPGTTAVLGGTMVSTGGGQISTPTVFLSPPVDAPVNADGTASQPTLYILIGVVIILVVMIAVGWYLLTLQKHQS